MFVDIRSPDPNWEIHLVRYLSGPLGGLDPIVAVSSWRSSQVEHTWGHCQRGLDLDES